MPDGEHAGQLGHRQGGPDLPWLGTFPTMRRMPTSSDAPRAIALPTFARALAFWTKLGFISFGGPTGQIAIMHEELVERRRWISEERFLHALSYCMVLPGPEAQQLATYVGWLLHGVPGGVAAGALFVLPSLVLLLGLSWAYAAHGTLPAVQGVLLGIKPVVIAIVAVALWRIGSKSLKTPAQLALAVAGGVAIALLHAPFPLVVLGAGVVGFAGARVAPAQFRGAGGGHGAGGQAPEGGAALDALLDARRHVQPSVARTLRIVAALVVLWGGPMAAAFALRDTVPVLWQQGLFFSQAALVTFGGAYAVLPYIAFAGITTFGWVTAPQMIDGLALGETTPGPLIMVTTFVGFLGGWTHAGAWSPLATAMTAGVLTTYMTFLFSFFFIFLGAPYIERFRGHASVSAALAGVSAAVVGVIANLGVYLAAHVFVPDGRIDLVAVAIAVAAFAGLRWRQWPMHAVVLAGAVVGVARVLAAR